MKEPQCFLIMTLTLQQICQIGLSLLERMKIVTSEEHLMGRDTIRNLVINSPSQYTGLFGYSTGTTIKNVVIDSTCSVVSNYASSENHTYTGSIIGYCESNEGACTIENSVNMANATFSGNTIDFSFTGGIVGAVALENYNVSIKNCANYGIVKNIGSSEESYIGGIVGDITSFSSSYNYIQNCINYDTVFFNGTTNQLLIGGISGYSQYGNLNNCVSSGFIVIATSSIETKYVGSIVGYAEYSSVSHCYWDMSIDHEVYDFDFRSSATNSYSFNSTSFELDGTISIGNYTGTSLIGTLNGAADYYTLRNYSHWALNKDKRSIKFTINNRNNPFTMDSQIILLPDLANEGRIEFDGWYKDTDCTVALDDYFIESDDETSLYGRWAENTNNYTISFDTRGGTSVPSITGQFGTTVKLTKKPTNTKGNDCKFQFWETEYGDKVPTGDFTIPAQNITLYAVWFCTHIRTAEDLIALSNVVNYYGINCKGITVFLDNDIDFSEVLSTHFEPIGKDENNYFRGTFDGQGHVIRNLTINSYSKYTGLFGYSTGTNIKNAVIDVTCNIVNNLHVNDYQAFIGSIIGICISIEGTCNIEDNVNMADVTFNGNTKSLNIGCIAGAVVLSDYKTSVKNCVNYGIVKTIGTSESSVSIGGIVGSSQKIITSTSSSYVNVQNCLNYGTVLFNGISNEIRVGGISGFNYYSNLDNCVSSGSIIVVFSNIEDKGVGSIAGYTYSSSISRCYWTKDSGCDEPIGLPDESTSIITYYVEQLNTTILNELNEYANRKGLNKWFMLHLNGGRINNIAQSELVEFQSHIPVPVRENNTFLRWCKDAECNEAYGNDASGVTDLYAVWNTVYVTFLFENGTVVGPVGVKYGGKYGSLPETEKEGWSFYWSTSKGGGGKVVTNETNVTTLNDHMLHGCWTKNKYTVTFDLGNGTVIEEMYYYDDKISKPSNIEREECIFYGWDNKAEFMPSQSITITALWNCTQSSSSSSPSASSSSKEVIIIESKSKSSSNTGAIVGGVVGSILAVVVIVLVVLFLIFYKKKEDTAMKGNDDLEMTRKNPRIVEKSSNAPVNTSLSSTLSGVSDSIAKFYPGNYKIPTIAEALRMAGLDEGRVSDAVEACTLTVHYASKEGKLTDAFAKEDAAAVALYTFDFGGDDFESNPYRIINKALTSGRDEDLQKASGLLYVVMCALRRLPKSTGRTLYRGVRAGVDMEQYKEGCTVVWRGLSSTSPDMKATKAFLASNTANGKAEGTLFVIDDGWGYDIQPYSLFPDEAEILLEPEREFRVQDVIDAELTVVKLQMLDTPLILPQVFGENVN